MAEPSPTEVAPWYLRNITQALALDETTGNVYVRTNTNIDIGNANISIGNVGIESFGNVDISGNTLPVTVDSGNITITGGNVNATVSGTVAVSSITGNLAGITGNVTVVDGGGSLTVDGNVGITGNVNIGTMPNVNASVSGNVGVTGNVNIGTMPNVNASVSGNVGVISLGNVVLTGNTLPVSGNVGISGNVDIGTMPNVNANITGGNVTVSGNVGVTSLGNVDLTGNTLPVSGNVTVQQGTSPWVVSGNVGISGNANVILADDASVVISGFSGAVSDAFGRLRVSNPYTLFDTQARYFDHGQFASNIAGTANVVYVANQSSYQLNVGSASGDSVLRETLKPFPYQPGKSQLTLNTFCMNTPKANLRQRVGLFDSNDGVFFENDGTYNYMVIRSGSTGVEERVRQDAWNVDQLNGTGPVTNPSGYTLYPDRTQIMFADVEWLGVGSVRVGFVINGAYIICHQFNHANQTGNTKVYMTTATLPIRYEITNTGATSGNSMMTQICSTVISEGGFQLTGSGNPRAASHLIGTPVRLPNDVSFKPIISIRLKSTNLNAVVIPTAYSIVPLAQSFFQYRIYKKAITSGGTWVSSALDSSVEYNLAPTALVSGDIAEQTFLNSTNQSTGAPIQTEFSFEYQLEREPFTGVAYEYVITMATTGQNQDVYASVEWQEIS
jgi:hypothetical protein